MAPNTKETAAVIDSLANLNVNDLVHSNFLPLTQKEEAPSSDTTLSNAEDTGSTTQEDTAPNSDILKYEENRQPLFVLNIQSDSATATGHVTTATYHDDYFNMPAPTTLETLAEEEKQEAKEKKSQTTAKVNGELNCLWHMEHEEQKGKALTASIVEDGELRETISVNTIEASLIADAKRHQHDDVVPTILLEKDCQLLAV